MRRNQGPLNWEDWIGHLEHLLDGRAVQERFCRVCRLRPSTLREYLIYQEACRNLRVRKKQVESPTRERCP